MNRVPETAALSLAVDVQNLSRAFGSNAALVDVSLQIPVGSIYGLVGLNGAGKTTLIRHLIGSFCAEQGSVRVLGQDPVAEQTTVLKKVGYLSEEDSLPKWMRIGDLIDFTRAIYPTWDDAYAKQLCDTFELSRGTRLRTLSKGQRARVGLLAAIAHRPELLILDEPSSGLDPIARSDILQAVIRTISQDGRTVLFSSHILEEVDRVCDAVAVMRAGRILETLTTEQLQTRYREIICRPRIDGWTPTATAGVFDWRQDGSEWSAVIDTTIAAEGDHDNDLGLIEDRPITLARWFSARVRVKETPNKEQLRLSRER
jgi:ABC-2 type transport system ATP-binding protein